MDNIQQILDILKKRSVKKFAGRSPATQEQVVCDTQTGYIVLKYARLNACAV